MKLLKNVMVLAAVACGLLIPGQVRGADTTYRYLWSHYTGWEPWQYISDSGIMKKWADKYNVKVEIVLINDYVTSINTPRARRWDVP